MGWRYAISAPVGLPGDAARNRDSRHAVERHSGGLSSRLNWPRAAVLGANDGIVSVAGIVLGVAGPPRREAPYSPLGRRAWWPARCRWRSGEYVPVSSQPDSDKSLLARDRQELMEMPAAELDELAAIYEAKGVSPETAAQVVAELTAP